MLTFLFLGFSSLDLTTPLSTPSSGFEVCLDCEDDEKKPSDLELLESSSVNTDCKIEESCISFFLSASTTLVDKGRSDFERDPDRAVDSKDGDMTSAEDSSDLKWDVFLDSSSESDSSSLESTIKIFFLCNSVDDSVDNFQFMMACF